MMQQRIEARWIEAFVRAFGLCGIRAGENAAILSEARSRPVNARLAELALLQLGARVFHVVLPSPRLQAPVPVRSTGASDAIGGLAPVAAALSGSGFVPDLTVEGLLHAPELPQFLAGGARVLMVSNEHPETLERCVPDPGLEAKVKAGMRLLRKARRTQVSSDAGTQLTIGLIGARVGGGRGYTARPGSISHWPGGSCLAGEHDRNAAPSVMRRMADRIRDARHVWLPAVGHLASMERTAVFNSAALQFLQAHFPAR